MLGENVKSSGDTSVEDQQTSEMPVNRREEYSWVHSFLPTSVHVNGERSAYRLGTSAGLPSGDALRPPPCGLNLFSHFERQKRANKSTANELAAEPRSTSQVIRDALPPRDALPVDEHFFIDGQKCCWIWLSTRLKRILYKSAVRKAASRRFLRGGRRGDSSSEWDCWPFF